MSRNVEAPGATEMKAPSPAKGLVFMMGCLGLLYGFISVVDPLL